MNGDWQPIDPTPPVVVRVQAQTARQKRICAKCGQHPRKRGQRWCRACHADYMREWRVKCREELEHLRGMCAEHGPNSTR